MSLEPWYSNPYVSHEQCASDRDAMFDRLRAGDVDAFAALAASYGVDYVAVDRSETNSSYRLDPVLSSRYAVAFDSNTIRVYRVAPDSLRPR